MKHDSDGLIKHELRITEDNGTVPKRAAAELGWKKFDGDKDTQYTSNHSCSNN